ncbi:hypothetical protein D3C81_1324160 [compost metagenome]
MQYIAVNPFRLGHLAFKGQAQADQATPLKAARRGPQQRLAIDQQVRPVELHLPGLFVFTAVHVQPGQDVGTGADGHAVAARRRVEQLRQDRHGRIGVIPLQGQRGAQQRDHEAVMDFALGNVAKQLFEAGGAGHEVPGIQLHPRLENAQLDPGLYLFDRQQPHQLDQHAQVAMGVQRLAVLFHQIGGGRRVAAHDRMVHRFIQVIVLAEPVPCANVHRLLLGVAARVEILEQGFAQQWVQAIPGFALGAVHRNQEQVVPLQPRQQRVRLGNRLRVTAQGSAQRGAETVAHGHEQQQVQVGR